MITTVRSDMTWGDPMARALRDSSEKKIKQMLKEFTGASDVDIIEVNSWSEEDDEDWDE